jgi:hypothetical protein
MKLKQEYFSPWLSFDETAHDDSLMDSATVQKVAYMLKYMAHRYADMNGKDAIEFAADALLKADLECLS